MYTLAVTPVVWHLSDGTKEWQSKSDESEAVNQSYLVNSCVVGFEGAYPTTLSFTVFGDPITLDQNG